jgi:capsular exopolysaccharide synthesis family protein
VLNQVIRDLRLAERWASLYGVSSLTEQETFKLLTKRIDPRQIRNTSIIEIRVFSKSAEEAAEIANKIAASYTKYRLEERKRLSETGLQKLREDYAVQTNKVAEVRAELDLMRTNLGIIMVTPDASRTIMTIETDSLRQQEALLNERQAILRKKETQLNELQKIRDTNPELLVGAMTQVVGQDEKLINLVREKDTAEQQFEAKKKEYGEENVEYKKAQAILERVTTQLANVVNGSMQGLSVEVNALKAEVELAGRKVEEYTARSQRSAANTSKYANLLEVREEMQRIADALHTKVTLEQVDAEIPRNAIVTITDRAVKSEKAHSPSIPINVTLGIVVGLIFGVGLAFFIEYLDTSVKTIDDVERALNAPVVGVIPQNVSELVNEGAESPHAEAYRVLRTNVLFSRKDPKANSITVVSGGAGEGKSTTILNLASVFAQNGHKVLLVDSDLRRPSLHKRLKVSNSIGLTNYLLGQNKLEEVIQTCELAGLHFLPSGKLPSSSLGILNSQQMRDFIKEVKQRYDFVFFDSPPIMGVSDASILVSEVDLTLLIIQYRKYPQAMNVRAKQMVDNARGTLLGVVLNNINISQDSYYYYYSGYDYHAKASDDDEPGEAPGKKNNGEPAKPTVRSKY